jgi:hypothetical protein
VTCCEPLTRRAWPQPGRWSRACGAGRSPGQRHCPDRCCTSGPAASGASCRRTVTWCWLRTAGCGGWCRESPARTTRGAWADPGWPARAAGVDPDAGPPLGQVLAVRRERMGEVRGGFVRVIRPQLLVTDDRTAAARVSMLASSDVPSPVSRPCLTESGPLQLGAQLRRPVAGVPGHSKGGLVSVFSWLLACLSYQ